MALDPFPGEVIGDGEGEGLVVEPDAGRAVGDTRRTWQVLTNLVGNAVKFSGDGATVTVSVEREDDHVVVAVTDTGPGIPPELQHLLFQRFIRLAGTSGVPGSGVGLFIAKSLVEAQNGEITVDSTPGVGSTFRFWLPAAR